MYSEATTATTFYFLFVKYYLHGYAICAAVFHRFIEVAYSSSLILSTRKNDYVSISQKGNTIYCSPQGQVGWNEVSLKIYHSMYPLVGKSLVNNNDNHMNYYFLPDCKNSKDKKGVTFFDLWSCEKADVLE